MSEVQHQLSPFNTFISGCVFLKNNKMALNIGDKVLIYCICIYIYIYSFDQQVAVEDLVFSVNHIVAQQWPWSVLVMDICTTILII